MFAISDLSYPTFSQALILLHYIISFLAIKKFLFQQDDKIRDIYM